MKIFITLHLDTEHFFRTRKYSIQIYAFLISASTNNISKDTKSTHHNKLKKRLVGALIYSTQTHVMKNNPLPLQIPKNISVQYSQQQIVSLKRDEG